MIQIKVAIHERLYLFFTGGFKMTLSSEGNSSINDLKQDDVQLHPTHPNQNRLSIRKIWKQIFSLYFNQLGWIVLLGIFAGTVPTYLSGWANTSFTIHESISVYFYSLVITISVLISVFFMEVGVFVSKNKFDGVAISWQQACIQAAKKYFRIVLFMIPPALAVFLACCFLIIPGIFLSLCLACYFPVALLENRSIRESWTRSCVLTKGSRSKIFLLWLTAYLLNGIVILLPAGLLVLFFSENVIILDLSPVIVAVSALFTWPLYGFLLGFMYCQLHCVLHPKEP